MVLSSHPSVLIAAPIRYRPECPEVLGEYLEALRTLEWAGEKRFYFAFHAGEDYDQRPTQYLEDLADGNYGMLAPDPPETGLLLRNAATFVIPSTPDSRLINGPRRTTETQLNLAYLRSRIFHHWQFETQADLCLMVDSDVVLAPGALARMHGDRVKWGKNTISLQINNKPADSLPPAANAWLDTEHKKRAPWATDGSMIEVARSGACTLYPRAACRFRFTFDPTQHHEEHEGLFDRLSEEGFRHYLIRDPSLADHRMKRWESVAAALEKVKAMGRKRREEPSCL